LPTVFEIPPVPGASPRPENAARAREEERTHLSRELHDGVGAVLAGLIMFVGAAQTGTAGRPRELLAAVERDLTCAAGELRGVIEQLRPPALSELGLTRALERHAERLSAASALRITVHADEGSESLRPDLMLAVYRIATEAMVNAARHAGASNCAVVVRTDCESVRLGVSDDGRGLQAAAQPGVGMSAMRGRAADLGGSCTWRSQPLGGTTVRCRLPLAHA
jgi:signal transduction histidine kinase